MNYQPQYSPYGQFNQNNIDFSAHKRAEKKNIATISKACGSAVIAFVIFGIIVGFIIGHSERFMTLYETDEIFTGGITVIISLLTIAAPFLLAYSELKSKKLVGELPLGEPYNKKDFFLFIPIMVMVCIFGSIATGLFSSFVNDFFGIEFSQPDDGSSYGSVAGVAMSMLSTAVIPAFVEEFAIRGVVMQALRKYGDAFAIVMSSFVFALMHGNMLQIPFAFIAGIGIGYAVIKTGTMWTGIIVHFINNAIAVIFMTVDANCSEETMNNFVMILYATIFAVGIGCIIIYLLGKRQEKYILSQGHTNVLNMSDKVSQFVFTLPMLFAIGILIFETSMYISSNG